MEAKIVKTRREVDELATAFVKAKSVLLQTSIEKKMQDYEILLSDLSAQQAQLEIERGWCVSKRDLMEFIAELLKGDLSDKDHQRKLIDNLVYMVYVFDGYKVVYLNLSGGKGIEGDRITLTDTDNALKGVLDIRTQFLPARQIETS